MQASRAVATKKLPCVSKGALLRYTEFLAISAIWLSGTTPTPPKVVILPAALVLRYAFCSSVSFGVFSLPLIRNSGALFLAA